MFQLFVLARRPRDQDTRVCIPGYGRRTPHMCCFLWVPPKHENQPSSLCLTTNLAQAMTAELPSNVHLLHPALHEPSSNQEGCEKPSPSPYQTPFRQYIDSLLQNETAMIQPDLPSPEVADNQTANARPVTTPNHKKIINKTISLKLQSSLDAPCGFERVAHTLDPTAVSRMSRRAVYNRFIGCELEDERAITEKHFAGMEGSEQ